MSVTVEIAGYQAVPPAPGGGHPERCRDVAQVRPVVLEELQRHPFAGGDEIEAPVSVPIDPYRVRDHAAGVHQIRRDLLRDIGEAATVVAQQVAACGIGIVARRQTTADEEIWFAVAGEIARHDPRGARRHLGQGLRIAAKAPAAFVDVEPVLQQRRHRRQLISAARDIEIGPAIAVGIEEHRAPVFVVTIHQPRLSRRRVRKAAARFLDEQHARNA